LSTCLSIREYSLKSRYYERYSCNCSPTGYCWAEWRILNPTQVILWLAPYYLPDWESPLILFRLDPKYAATKAFALKTVQFQMDYNNAFFPAFLEILKTFPLDDLLPIYQAVGNYSFPVQVLFVRFYSLLRCIKGLLKEMVREARTE
jgi:hypothetical protein